MLILARTINQARTVMRPGDKILAILPDDLFGRADCALITVGDFWARPDFKPEEVYFYCKSHNITMPQSIISMVKEARNGKV